MAGTGLFVGGDHLYRIDVEAVAEGVEGRDGEELLHCLVHDRLIQSVRAHVLVDISIAHEHDIDTVAHRRGLQGQDLAVFRVIGRFIGLRLQDALQERNQVCRCVLAETVPDGVRIVDETAVEDIALRVIDLRRGNRHRNAGTCPPMEVIPLVVPLFLHGRFDAFLVPPRGKVLIDLDRGDDLEAVLMALFIEVLQLGHHPPGILIPGRPGEIEGIFVPGDHVFEGKRLPVKVLNGLMPVGFIFGPGVASGNLHVRDVETITLFLPEVSVDDKRCRLFLVREERRNFPRQAIVISGQYVDMLDP